MTELGHERFAVVGHDRGSYVAFRLALDHPSAVTRLVLLDCVPIGEALARADARFPQAWWHWFFFAQPGKPERPILADPDAWYGAGDELEARMGSENYADRRAAVHDPAVVTAMLEDYRAGLGPDRADDDTDRASGRQVTCPTLLLWSSRDDIQEVHDDILAVWQPWAHTTRGAHRQQPPRRRSRARRPRPRHHHHLPGVHHKHRMTYVSGTSSAVLGRRPSRRSRSWSDADP
jgi:haloacetate dehalogenase